MLSFLCTTCLSEESYDIDIVPDFSNLGDPAVLQFIQDSIFIETETLLPDESYTVESVSAIYISQEYIDELFFNSQSNIFFGYTLAEVDAMFNGEKYVFTLGENNETTVIEFEPYDNSIDYSTIFKNIAIGAGIIIVCVVVSVVTKGTGTPKAIQILHFFSTNMAQKAVSRAASFSIVGAISAGVSEAYETGDMDAALRESLKGASEGFKCGAIWGTIEGGVNSLFQYLSSGIPTWQESEVKAEEIYANKQGVRNQVSYLNGEEVGKFTDGATRPDLIVTNKNGITEAIEVKNYDLKTAANRSEMLSILEREIDSRSRNLPNGFQQRIVIDARGRGYTQKFTDWIKQKIQDRLDSVYPNIPVDFIW